jgi:hypothetical protein
MCNCESECVRESECVTALLRDGGWAGGRCVVCGGGGLLH